MRLLCLGADLEGLPHELLVEALKLLEAQGKAQCVLSWPCLPTCLACPDMYMAQEEAAELHNRGSSINPWTSLNRASAMCRMFQGSGADATGVKFF